MVLHASAFFVLTKPFPECSAPVLILSVWRKNKLPSQLSQDLDRIPQKTNEFQQTRRKAGAFNWGGEQTETHTYLNQLVLLETPTSQRKCGAIPTSTTNPNAAFISTKQTNASGCDTSHLAIRSSLARGYQQLPPQHGPLFRDAASVSIYLHSSVIIQWCRHITPFGSSDVT